MRTARLNARRRNASHLVLARGPYSKGMVVVKDMGGAAPAVLFLEYLRALDRADLTI